MCTLTWLKEDNQYTVLFNRDELKSRSKASKPQIYLKEDVRFVAPIDPDGHGTWIGANEYGLTCCLLNHYPTINIDTQPKVTSRGLLVLSTMPYACSKDVIKYIHNEDLLQYRPFKLIIFDPGEDIVMCVWDGQSLAVIYHNVRPPITSSSFDGFNVNRLRHKIFQSYCSEPTSFEQLKRFHMSHDPGKGPYSVCTHREHAETVNFNCIRVRMTGIHFESISGSPCSSHDGKIVVLRRKVSNEFVQHLCHSS